MVTLDRVVCCYPHVEALLEAALRHSHDLFAFSYPRNVRYVRAALALENGFRRVRRNPFRTFVHAPAVMEHTVTRSGFALLRRRRTGMWSVDVYGRGPPYRASEHRILLLQEGASTFDDDSGGTHLQEPTRRVIRGWGNYWMSKPLLGILVGAGLGAIDGLSAWFSPEARSMMIAIVIGSTVKGIVTGLLAGLIATWRRSMPLGVGSGLAIGFGLSSLAAIGQAGHYLEIVLPGMLVGALVGFLTQKYPQDVVGRRAVGPLAIVLAVTLSPGLLLSAQQATPVRDNLAPLAGVVGRWVGTTEGRPAKAPSSGSTSAFSAIGSSR